MRGKRESLRVGESPIRITPADAGKTDYATDCQGLLEDHPRGCGENQKIAVFGGRHGGSPPRMRGKRAAALVRRAGAGITPADAGKTRASVGDRYRDEDHPRGCGENTMEA